MEFRLEVWGGPGGGLVSPRCSVGRQLIVLELHYGRRTSHGCVDCFLTLVGLVSTFSYPFSGSPHF